MAAFQIALPKLEVEGIGVVSASADSQADAEQEALELKLTFPLGYGLDALQTAAAVGAFHGEAAPPRNRFIQATAFVLNAQHKVVNAVYSSGAYGRLTWQEVLNLVRYLKTARAPAAAPKA